MIRLWLWPLLLAIVSIAGLASGLAADGIGDIGAWVGLGIPLLVAIYCGFVRKA